MIYTVKAVFPSCRIFREHPRDDEAVEREGQDFTNVVIFCTKTSTKLSFRKPTPADMLNSQTRQQFLTPAFEVFDSDFLSTDEVRLVTKNDTAQLSKWHKDSALGHWEVMRRVVPAKVWENW